ncbi:MAG: translational GTPase TypA [Deltaproteobacteria bacterium]|uniref:50S ribosomal subunit assembly factor BipA n=1 Tax=Candidatus Acidulodesulfobacterium acidiphilum TaxID=2597224 RepID=A0A520XFI6_9DELT|nr:translational GTPase TypA [Deltaproteobacteria bacterium]RZV39950.1 MAG: translational GTPase TypA [Candidatus Acidulodesulfobacterium acidiphilum]
MNFQEKIRNIAVVAHVDHGKTTLIDKMLKESISKRDFEALSERAMDSDELEKERGITILSKCTGIKYKDYRINIVDTPGHGDFGSEVERVLAMVDGVLLLVDAFDGPMPQTRFILKKCFEYNLHVLLVINKIDRPGARPEEVLEMVYDLFLELGGENVNLDFPVIYASAKEGYAIKDLKVQGEERFKDKLNPLFDAIIDFIPHPPILNKPELEFLVTSIGHDDFLGATAIGIVKAGKLKVNDSVYLYNAKDELIKTKPNKIFLFDGLKRTETDEINEGDIALVAGLTGVNAGDYIVNDKPIAPLQRIKIDEPVILVNFIVNKSPFCGKEGKLVTTRQLRERLFKEVSNNVGLKVVETGDETVFDVYGRGLLHLSILIEKMRREGFEFAVSKPKGVIKEIDGKKMEPYELLYITVKDEFTGGVLERLSSMKGNLLDMTKDDNGNTYLEFVIPSRSIMGFHNEFLTMTKGTGTMNHNFYKFDEYAFDISPRKNGVMISMENGEANSYGLYNLQDRGSLFVSPQDEVYEGMIIGIHSKPGDITVNPCKKKQLTNMRSKASDEMITLTPPIRLSIEYALEFIEDDELVEFTPKSIRLRKKILTENDRKKESRGLLKA